MSNLTDIQIKNLKIEKIDEILSSNKFIPSNKKTLLLNRRDFLKKKNFQNKSEDFPVLKEKKTVTKPPTSAWEKKSPKVFDKSNAPKIKKENLLKSEKKKPIENKQNDDFDDEYSDEYSDEYDLFD